MSKDRDAGPLLLNASGDKQILGGSNCKVLSNKLECLLRQQ